MLAFTDKRPYLSESLQLSAGSLGPEIRALADKAQRAAASLWQHDPAAWTSDAATAKKIADRCEPHDGLLTSKLYWHDSLDRVRDLLPGGTMSTKRVERVHSGSSVDCHLLGATAVGLRPRIDRKSVV